MSIDLTKLTPAPWVSDKDGGVHYDAGQDSSPVANASEQDAEFIALARNAFDIMLRRGWGVASQTMGKWAVMKDGICLIAMDGKMIRLFSADDPFTALVEADRWHRENIEGK